METSALQWSVAVCVPLAIAIAAWLVSRRSIGIGWLGLVFAAGFLATFPISRLSNVIDPLVGHWAEHPYLEELLRQWLSIALPEEWGKGLAAVLVWRWMGRSKNPLNWLVCAGASHCGFAALEGLFGAMGNEGMLKVLLGRSLGATLHCSWGLTAAWFAWRAYNRSRFRWINWSMALVVPSVLHAVGNASMMEIPGQSSAAESDAVSLAELAVVLPGMAIIPASWALAVWSIFAAGRKDRASTAMG
jgi:RsiW-degrading membrane proteinase PrsW (M82 family)